MSEEKQYMLILDDDEDYVEVTAELLHLTGYENVFKETNPLEALELVKNYNVVFIISDYKMPQLNGIAFFEKVRNLNLDRKIYKVICTGYSELESDMNTMIEDGIIDDFIIKTLKPDMFLRLVKRSWTRIENTFSRNLLLNKIKKISLEIYLSLNPELLGNKLFFEFNALGQLQPVQINKK